MNIFQKKQWLYFLILAACMLGMDALVIYAVLSEPSPQRYIVLFFVAMLLAITPSVLFQPWKSKRQMKALRIDKAAIRSFEEELNSGSVTRFKGIAVTAHWVACLSMHSLALYPLDDIVCLRLDRQQWAKRSRDAYVYCLIFTFTNGKKFKLCSSYMVPNSMNHSFNVTQEGVLRMKELVSLLIHRCPKINSCVVNDQAFNLLDLWKGVPAQQPDKSMSTAEQEELRKLNARFYRTIKSLLDEYDIWEAQ